MLLDRSVSRVTDHIGRSTDANLLLDWPVHSIEYSSHGASLRGSGGRQIRCGKVIITVPVLALQQDDILFKPPLPQEKRSAIERIQMSNAVKVSTSILALQFGGQSEQTFFGQIVSTNQRMHDEVNALDFSV